MALYEWNIECHEVTVNGSQITYSAGCVVVVAEDETAARKIIAEDEPGLVIDTVTIGQRLELDDDE